MATNQDYTRFIILSGPRTGSHMLAQALNSSPNITCFREIFNTQLDFLQFGVEGYDNFSSRDIALRKEDPVRFLEERIFCGHPDEVGAVGFKFHHGHHWGAPGILERLEEDKQLRVIDLQRRNALRMLVSLKLAEATGVWVQESTPTLTGNNLLKALLHPAKAAKRLWRRAKKAQPPARTRPRKVTISPEECYEHFVAANVRRASYDELFQGHPRLPVYYEDMIERREDVFAEAQSFLGVRKQHLTVTMRQQNPEPLRDLLANYEELSKAFAGTPQESFFE